MRYLQRAGRRSLPGRQARLATAAILVATALAACGGGDGDGGGGAEAASGAKAPATIPELTDVPPTAPILREEIFGPVAPIVTFTDEAEAIRLANDTEYGLVSYVFTNDLGRALKVSEALEFGMVGLNQGIVSNAAAPFGGVKHSGFGREGGFEGIEEYLSVKYVGIAP